MTNTYDNTRQVITAEIMAWAETRTDVVVSYANRPIKEETTNKVIVRPTLVYTDSVTSAISNRPHVRRTGNIVFRIFDSKGNGTARTMAVIDSLIDRLEHQQLSHVTTLSGHIDNATNTGGASSNSDDYYYQTNLLIKFRIND